MTGQKNGKKAGKKNFKTKISRRQLLQGSALAFCSAVLPTESGCRHSKTHPRRIKERVIILGFDAVSPVLLKEYMSRGLLPNLDRLARDGSFSELTSSIPPESPVAWATFSVSAQAGVHGIYDFLNRDRETYSPQMAAVKIIRPEFLWDFIPWRRTRAVNLMSGKPFWVHAAQQGIKCAALEAPMAFPACELESESVLLSGLNTPDLRLTQGTYHFFYTGIQSEKVPDTPFGGKVYYLKFGPDRRAEANIIGPWNPIKSQKIRRLLELRNKMAGRSVTELSEIDRELDILEKDGFLTIPVGFEFSSDRSQVTITIERKKITLAQGQWSDWVELDFSLNCLVCLKGMARFFLLELGQEVKIFMSPIEIHPEDPVLPISWPGNFSAVLAGSIGLYKTRGWAAETAALKESKLDEKAFLEDLNLIIDKREAMAFHVLEKEKPSLFFEVFSCPDRVQHMFWRLIDKDHPAYDKELDQRFGDAILKVYCRMDDFVGRVRSRFEDEHTLLVILSDHGFSSFRKGVNINTWLVENGYMKLKGGENKRYKLKDLSDIGEFFLNVDWTGTRAYSLGLGLIFVNLKGRERLGIVEPGTEYAALMREIAQRLEAFRDPQDNSLVVRKVYPGREVYRGPRLDQAPDLVVGFNYNYRVSWQTALGGVAGDIIEPNTEKWSGDHCSVDRDLVPGVLLVNRKINLSDPDLRDIAPTVLRFLGCSVPEEYEGRDLFAGADTR